MAHAVDMSLGARFVRDRAEYERQQSESFPVCAEQRALYDDNDAAGIQDPHYFYQDLWAARRVFRAGPTRHVDIGSRLDGFVAHLLAFMPVEVVDIRPLASTVDGLTFRQADATNLEGFEDNSVESLSSLHAVEHFGLGRYGDPVYPEAWRKALGSMARVLEPQGHLYLSVPVGRERVVFNAHRVFDPVSIVNALDGLELKSFALVDDQGRFHEQADPEAARSLEYGCGLFEFEKPDNEDDDCDPAWTEHAELIGRLIETFGPKKFTKWCPVRDTMFERGYAATRSQLGYLQSLSNWTEHWRPAVTEDALGEPEPFPLYPESSANLIHHAYHVARFEDVVGKNVDGLHRVVEFGGGYGSMRRLLWRLGQCGQYQIYDLPELAALQKWYLGQLKIPFESLTNLDDLERVEPRSHTLFIATWSLSEVPIAARAKVLEKVRDADAFLIAYQSQFKNLDNLSYFAEWQAAIPGVQWFDLPIEHMPGDRHLFGVRS